MNSWLEIDLLMVRYYVFIYLRLNLETYLNIMKYSLVYVFIYLRFKVYLYLITL